MHIVIVGSGASGVAVALMVLRQLTAGDSITHIDSSTHIGSGVAYSTPDDTLLLNVRASNMSVYADQPHHFVDWLGTTHAHTDASAFVPRRWYAQYLGETLQAATIASAGTYTHIDAHVADIHPHGRIIMLADGRQVHADHIILALGHAPIANPLQRWVPTPARVIAGYDWARIRHTIAPDAPVIIIGTGLTMVDAVSTLWHSEHRAPIMAISRHGHLPHTHITYTPHAGFISAHDYGVSVRQLMRMVRHEVAAAQQQGEPWQAVVDSLRPHTQALWMGWSLADKRRFLRHVRAHWDIYRHRIAPHLATQLSAAQQHGQLSVVAGRITAYTEADAGVMLSYTPRGSHTSIAQHAAWIINCTGPESDYTHITNPLVTALRHRGMLNADSIRLGIDVDADGHLKDADGHIIPWLWTIGPPRKGFAWECIAIPDIRVQAMQLANALMMA